MAVQNMKFGELKTVINRSPGRHDWVAVTIGLGTDAIISAESPILDLIDDYEVAWIAPPETCWGCNCPKMEEPKKGRWEDIVELDSGGYPFKVGVCCSACGFQTLSEDNYCPYCGAKMEEKA